MNDAYALFNKITPLILKYFLRMQMKYQSTKKCIEILMIEVYKSVNVLSPGIISDIFKLRKNIYNVRNVHAQNPRTKKFG